MELCKNCEQALSGNFCARCGQARPKRIDSAYLLHEAVHVITHADKGIVSFVRRLVTEPGRFAVAYIDGQRKVYSPFQYLAIIVGIHVLLINIPVVYTHIAADATGNGAKHLAPQTRHVLQAFLEFVRRYANLLSLLTVPVFAYFGKLFFPSRYNLGEYVTIQVFASALVNTISVVVLLLPLLIGKVFVNVYYSFALMLTCSAITYKQAFGLSWPSTAGRSVLAFGFSFVVQVIIVTVIAAIFIFMQSYKGYGAYIQFAPVGS